MLGIWDLAGNLLGAPVASVQVGERGYAYLVDENGLILYHPDAALIGSDGSKHPAVAAVMEGETGARALSVDGGTTMVGYAPIPIRRSPVRSLPTRLGGWGCSLPRCGRTSSPTEPLRPLMAVLLVCWWPCHGGLTSAAAVSSLRYRAWWCRWTACLRRVRHHISSPATSSELRETPDGL
jgi:hypothetical protein